MKILLIDQNGECVDFAWRAARDGHKVRHFIKDDPNKESVGKGMGAEIIREYRPSVKWADIIIFAENSRYMLEGDAWRKDGIPVIGATVESAAWEIDRHLGQDIFEKHGIPTLPCKTFTRYDDAIAYVKREKKRFVSKPAGDEADKALSYVSKSPADMVFMLERWQKLGKLKPPFILQEFVEGIEMAVAGWVGPGGFNQGWEENFEFKKLMVGEMGPNTGEMGTVLRYVKDSKLAEKVLKPLEDAIVATGHTGDIDVNCIIDKEGNPWPLEFTCRFGYPAMNIQNALHEGDTVEWLMALLEGEDAKNFRLDEIAAGVVLAIPDYPYSRLTGKSVVGIPVYGLTPSIEKSLHPCQIMLGEAPQEVDGKLATKPCWVTAGDYVLVSTGTGDTVSAATKEAYKTLDKISLPNSPMWRTDIGSRLKKQLPLLQAQGYATDLTF